MKRIVTVWLLVLGMALIAIVTGCVNRAEPAPPVEATDAGGDGTAAEQSGNAENNAGNNGNENAGSAENDGGTGNGNADNAEIDRVVVSRSIDFNLVNERPYAVFEVKHEIAAFDKAVETGEKMRGVLDIDFPDYDIVIDQNGERRELQMWLDRNGNRGMFVYVGKSGTGYTMTEEATTKLIELIWGIRYDSDMAAANGDVVAALSGGVLNAERWLTFVDKLENGERDEVQVVHYTIEGDPIFRNMIYDGNSFRLRYDTTHDANGAPLDRTDFCEGVHADEMDEGTVYTLKGCGDSETWFELMLPGKQEG